MSIISVRGNFRIVADIEFVNDDETSTKVSVQQDDIVDISYVKNSSLLTIKGRIKRIYVEPNILVIDSSLVYDGSLVEVYIGNIRSLSIIEPIIVEPTPEVVPDPIPEIV